MKANYFHINNGDISSYSDSTDQIEQLSRMNRKKAYWISQISGWSIFAIVNIIVSASFDYFSWENTIELLYLCFCGVLITHVFRNIVKKNGWLSLQLKRIIPRVLIASVIMGVILSFLFYIISIGVGTFQLNHFRAAFVLADLFRLSTTVLLWALIYFAVHYFENYRQVQIESLIWEAAVKDFELKTLKSQLNPHFMFNALNSIRALIGVDPKSAQTAVTKLSSILRYSLTMERIETVPLEKEMQTVCDYLELETIRFEERLKYKIDIDPKSFKIEIPPMMIQTLVENGLKHGISKRTEGGEITIKSEVQDSQLTIKIKNNGQISDEALQKSKGFGISNTKHRLHLLYGEKASFSIINKTENEVLAEIVIPIGGIKNESFNS